VPAAAAAAAAAAGGQYAAALSPNNALIRSTGTPLSTTLHFRIPHQVHPPISGTHSTALTSPQANP
jgi:hypothetical protein